jgi:hypothetical protein
MSAQRWIGSHTYDVRVLFRSSVCGKHDLFVVAGGGTGYARTRQAREDFGWARRCRSSGMTSSPEWLQDDGGEQGRVNEGGAEC